FHTVSALAICAALSASPLAAQGRCIRALGTAACNTDTIPAVFAKTGWRTTAVDHITWRVVDPRKEAAFYAALMGWKVRSADAQRVVMDIGDVGTAVFRKVPADSFAAPSNGRSNRPQAAVETIGFVIEPWDARNVERELRARGMTPVADNGANGAESFHVKDRDGFDIQLSNGKGYARARKASAPAAALDAPAPFEPTGWKTVWLDHISYSVTNYKASASWFMNLLGWAPTYDEGSQNELMIGDAGNIIVRGGNPLAPDYSPRNGGARSDHISFGISPWDTDGVKEQLEKRGLRVRIDTSDGSDIHVAMFRSYHTTTPNGYDLQISWITKETRKNLSDAVRPRAGRGS
ncbi:MAG TPA: VOC family protein, partial [Gemmatimonadaceae bacterium]|nr:VOC family protein [Gemmatimonadaceae bacterium]